LLFPGFLSASREGMSHAEIEDLLSIDDESLQDTYLYHLPPDPDNIRIPSSVLSLLVKDIKDYMVMQKSGGKKVVKWYHRQFTEVSIYNLVPLFIILFFVLLIVFLAKIAGYHREASCKDLNQENLILHIELR
jgi:hypothetical protein